MNAVKINKDSYTTQVVKVLMREIESGQLPPLSKLPSTRELAARFGVSKTVILFALNTLEERRLIHREERRGVFVSEMASNPDVLEVLVFVFAHDAVKHSFINRILSIISSEVAGGKINFYLRIVNLASFKKYSKDYILRLLKSETAKLSQTFHSDCVMIIAPEFEKEEIEECIKLSFPSIFLGNFKDGDYDDLSYNRIGFEENHYDFLVDFAIKKDFKEILLVVPDVLKDSKGFKSAVKRARNSAQKDHIEMSCVFEKDSRHINPEKRTAGMKGAITETVTKIKNNSVVGFDCVLDIDKMIDDLVKNGVSPQKNKLEFAVSKSCTNRVYGENIHHAGYRDEDIESFNCYLSEKLHELAAGKLHNFRFDYNLKATIKK